MPRLRRTWPREPRRQQLLVELADEPVALQPRGSFDARRQRCDDGTYTVQVCYLGQPEVNS